MTAREYGDQSAAAYKIRALTERVAVLEQQRDAAERGLAALWTRAEKAERALADALEQIERRA